MSLRTVELLAAAGILPAPLTASPEYEDRAAQIRTYLRREDGVAAVRWLPTPPPAWHPDHAMTTSEQRAGILDVHTYAGPAPYVGDPFLYEWRVAVDQAGGYVAGPAWIVYLPPDPRFDYVGARP